VFVSTTGARVSDGPLTRGALQTTDDMRRDSGHPMGEGVQPATDRRRRFHGDGARGNDIPLAGDGGALASSLLTGSIFGHDASIPAGSHALSRR
jgi:hypothetical protein